MQWLAGLRLVLRLLRLILRLLHRRLRLLGELLPVRGGSGLLREVLIEVHPSVNSVCLGSFVVLVIRSSGRLVIELPRLKKS